MSDAKEKEKDKHAEGGEQPADAKPKGKKKLIFISLGVVALLGGAGVPMLLMGGGEEAAQSAHVESEESVEETRRMETLDLGVFIVNLSETSSFLKTHIIIEYDAASLERQLMSIEGGAGAGAGHGGGSGHGGGAAGGGGGEGEGAAVGGTPYYLTKKETIFRHTIIRILSSKRVEDVLTPDGKDWLNDELVEGLNSAMGLEQPVVSQVYYTEFIIQ